MKYVELEQRAEDGGRPIPGRLFEHGENLVVLSHRQFLSLLYRVHAALEKDPITNDRVLQEIEPFLLHDHYAFREPDLPPTAFVREGVVAVHKKR